METNSREFGLFIDGLRLDRNMSREDLCEDVISLSQYKRYLRGASSIPNDKLVQLSDRLKFSISDIHLMYRARQDKQYKKILNIFSLIKSNMFDEAYKEANTLKTEIIVSNFNKLFFDFCYLNIQHRLKMVSDVHVLGIYSDLIDYPDSINGGSFNFVEIQILTQIVIISAKIEDYEAANYLYDILTSEKFNFSNSDDNSFFPIVYATLARIFGMQEEFIQVLEITYKGIKFCLKYETTSALSHLMMLNSFANYDLGNIEEAKLGAKKAFMQLYIEDKPDKLEQFKVIFENKFKMKLDDLVKL